MNHCIRVCEADKITHHQHSILIAFKNDNNNNSTTNNNNNQHPVVCYVKADSNEEIRWYIFNRKTIFK